MVSSNEKSVSSVMAKRALITSDIVWNSYAGYSAVVLSLGILLSSGDKSSCHGTFNSFAICFKTSIFNSISPDSSFWIVRSDFPRRCANSFCVIFCALRCFCIAFPISSEEGHSKFNGIRVSHSVHLPLYEIVRCIDTY